jgi:hypothetical protein
MVVRRPRRGHTRSRQGHHRGVVSSRDEAKGPSPDSPGSSPPVPDRVLVSAQAAGRAGATPRRHVGDRETHRRIKPPAYVTLARLRRPQRLQAGRVVTRVHSRDPRQTLCRAEDGGPAVLSPTGGYPDRVRLEYRSAWIRDPATPPVASSKYTARSPVITAPGVRHHSNPARTGRTPITRALTCREIEWYQTSWPTANATTSGLMACAWCRSSGTARAHPGAPGRSAPGSEPNEAAGSGLGPS